MSSWLVQCRIAGVVVEVGGDTQACQQDMQKFLKLYDIVHDQAAVLRFYVSARAQGYDFTCREGDSVSLLWSSDDAREVSAALEIHLYSRLIQYLHRHKDIFSIHAAALGVQERAVMFAGESGAGKSSICTAGLLAGAAYMSDEFTLLAHDGLVHAFPRPMQWEHKEHPAFSREMVVQTGLMAEDMFDFPDAKGEMSRCYLWHPAHVQRKPLALGVVVLHQYEQGLDSPELVAIPRHEALLALPQHLHVQSGMAKDLPRLNRRIPQDCLFYRLRFPDAREAWALLEDEVFRVRGSGVRFQG